MDEIDIHIDTECIDCDTYFSEVVLAYRSDSSTLAYWACPECGKDNLWESYGWNDIREEYGV